MAGKTPRVVAGELRPAPGAQRIALDTAAWRAWLADEQHRSFRFVHPAGVFTARKERKQRGGWYWIAYRQVRRTLYKTYLGRSETLTADRLRRAALTLTRLACRRSLHAVLGARGDRRAIRSTAPRCRGEQMRRVAWRAGLAPGCPDDGTRR